MQEEYNEILTQEEKIKLKKSNFLISSHYKASALEIKTTYLALYNIQIGNFSKQSDGIYVRLKASNIAEITKESKKTIYQKLKTACINMATRSIGCIDEIKHEFDFVPFITRAKYENGYLTIRFPNEMQDFLINIQSNFTLLPQRTIMSFKKNYTIKLYEILRKECFYPQHYNQNKDYMFIVEKPLSKLKFDMGLINPEEEGVRETLVKSHSYDRAVEKSRQTTYNKEYTKFSSRVLKVAMDEINLSEFSNIKISYSGKRTGRGGKITSVIFKIVCLEDERGKPLNRTKQEIIDFLGVDDIVLEEKEKFRTLTDEEKTDILMDAMFLFGSVELKGDQKLKKSDIVSVVETADYNLEKIKGAIELLKSTEGTVKNVTGWLIDCIQNNWKTVEKKEKRTTKPQKTTNSKNKNKFNDFHQREYSKEDFENMEKALIEQARMEE